MSRTAPDHDAPEPTPPADLAAYVHEPVARQDSETLRAIAAWCDRLADHRDAQPVEIDEEDDLVVNVNEDTEETGVVVSKLQLCGKDCDGCPHGPYDWRITGSGADRDWECLGRTDER